MRPGCHDSDAAAAAAGGNMAMKALRGMVNGAMSELSSAVSGNRPTASATAATAASREHVMAVKRDYISQPRLSESLIRNISAESGFVIRGSANTFIDETKSYCIPHLKILSNSVYRHIDGKERFVLITFTHSYTCQTCMACNDSSCSLELKQSMD